MVKFLRPLPPSPIPITNSLVHQQQLRQWGSKHRYSRKEGAQPENRSKNRYDVILPCESLLLVFLKN